MNEEVKALWLERLRSGTITQMQHYLGDVDGSRCCLGVLCDLAVEAGVIGTPELKEEDSALLVYDDSDVSLPGPVLVWSGLTGPEVPVRGYLGQSDVFDRPTLAGLNDGSSSYHDQPMIFDEIADVIETYL